MTEKEKTKTQIKTARATRANILICDIEGRIEAKQIEMYAGNLSMKVS